MADENPPPLFETVDINSRREDENHSNDEEDIDDDDDDLFASAVAEHQKPSHNSFNGSTSIAGLSINHPERVNVSDIGGVGRQLEPTLEEVETDQTDQLITVVVTDPHKIGEGMASYMAYRVTTKTNIPLFRRNSFSVIRRFSDFLGLHEKLVEKYLRSGRIIPPAPEKDVVGTTKVRMGNASEAGSDFLERRRASLERFLSRTVEHPKLRSDPDLREFLEAEGDLPRATNTSALSGAGVLRLFNKVGETVNKITYRMEENDPWFEERAQQLEVLDGQLRKLFASVDALVMNRRELASNTGAFARAAAVLSNGEEHTSLSRALSQLADLEEKLETLHMEQANADFGIFCELIKDYISLIGAIKDVFHERVKVFQNWQHAQMMLNKKRELKSKLELQERRDKAGQVGEEVTEWTAKVDRCQEEFDQISSMIKKELNRFEVNRVKDFKEIIVKYLEAQVDQQQQVVKYWEAFLPEAKAIA